MPIFIRGIYPGHLLDLKDIEANPNLLIVQSISKLHKIPGMRIGYLAASEEMIRRISTLSDSLVGECLGD